MAKTKIAYVCNDCGSDFGKWQGQCSECSSWNTLTQVRLGNGSAGSRASASYAGETAALQTLSQVDLQQLPRISTSSAELDRVLGGGIVPGSVNLLGGSPGAGKSTLLLQIACELAQNLSVIYVTGEESAQQVAMRARRLQLSDTNLQLLCETQVDQIIPLAQQQQPQVMIIDSIQVMHIEHVNSAPGSVSQVRECAASLTRMAKQKGIALMLVGHVTKDGTLAGPKVLEHIIDCSLMLEGDVGNRYRTLRATKNRFGAVNELGVFAMADQGLKEVKNPSAIFLSRTEEAAPGSAVMVVWEGTRPLLVEIQALVDESHLGNPRRVAVGLEQNRMAMLLAVLHRHGGLQLGDQDVFANVVGGVKVLETSADLALLLAIVSSFRDTPLPKDLVVFGEVGLSGEIRPVPSGQERIYEAAKHGFKRAIVPAANLPKEPIVGMELIGVEKLTAALEAI